MPTVYTHRITDPNTAHTVVAAHKRTKEAIEFLGAEVLLNTAEDVPDDKVDGEGRYNPEHH